MARPIKYHLNHEGIIDDYIKAYYLIKPFKHICSDLHISIKVGLRIMKELGLNRPKEIVAIFRGTHKPIIKNTIMAKKKTKQKNDPEKDKKIKKRDPFFPMREVDYSQKVMVKIDHKTWVYRDKTA